MTADVSGYQRILQMVADASESQWMPAEVSGYGVGIGLLRQARFNPNDSTMKHHVW